MLTFMFRLPRLLQMLPAAVLALVFVAWICSEARWPIRAARLRAKSLAQVPPEDLANLKLYLPQTLYAYPGLELKVCFENLVPPSVFRQLAFQVNSPQGKTSRRHWTATFAPEQAGASLGADRFRSAWQRVGSRQMSDSRRAGQRWRWEAIAIADRRRQSDARHLVSQPAERTLPAVGQSTTGNARHAQAWLGKAGRRARRLQRLDLGTLRAVLLARHAVDGDARSQSVRVSRCGSATAARRASILPRDSARPVARSGDFSDRHQRRLRRLAWGRIHLHSRDGSDHSEYRPTAGRFPRGAARGVAGRLVAAAGECHASVVRRFIQRAA